MMSLEFVPGGTKVLPVGFAWALAVADSLSLMGGICVFINASTQRDGGTRCVRWLSLCVAVFAVNSTLWVDWPGVDNPHHLVGLVCQSDVACVAIATAAMMSNSAQAAWNSCCGYQMLAQTLWPSIVEDHISEQRRFRWYHCFAWGSAAAVATLNTIWGCNVNSGCRDIAWDYQNGRARVGLLLFPTVLSLFANLIMGVFVLWRLHSHSTTLNRDRMALGTAPYLLAVAACWSPYIGLDLVAEAAAFEGHDYAYAIAHIIWQSLGFIFALIYFWPSSRRAWQRRFVQFQDRDMPDKDGAVWRDKEHARVLLAETTNRQILVDGLTALMPEASLVQVLRTLRSITDREESTSAELAASPELLREALRSFRTCQECIESRRVTGFRDSGVCDTFDETLSDGTMSDLEAQPTRCIAHAPQPLANS